MPPLITEILAEYEKKIANIVCGLPIEGIEQAELANKIVKECSSRLQQVYLAGKKDMASELQEATDKIGVQHKQNCKANGGKKTCVKCRFEKLIPPTLTNPN